MGMLIDQFDEHDRHGSWYALSSVATAFCFWRGLADSCFKFVKWKWDLSDPYEIVL
ncbi:hypothetical protein HanOQP8_Chr13g0505231 [Helianthus annuus]|nr:hypothetical protein HanOQP8_Chr13g0505231 [Helianthus annuus]